DLEKLKWLNGEWIRGLDDDDLTRRLVEHYRHRAASPTAADAGNALFSWLARHASDEGAFARIVRRTAPIVRERIRTLEEYAAIAACFFLDGLPSYPAADLV